MMKSIYSYTLFPEDNCEAALWGNYDFMRGNVSLCRLLVVGKQFTPKAGIDVLMHLAAQGYCQSLYAAAYAQYRYIASLGKHCQQNLLFIALGIDCVQECVVGLLVHVTRVDVRTAAEHKRVNVLQCLQERIAVRIRGNNQRGASCCYYRLIVCLGKRGIAVAEICCYAYDGASLT